MSTPHVSPVDAELALAEVHARREQVIGTNLVPAWFWRTLAILVLLFVAAVESRIGWVVAIGAVVYAIGLATIVVLVVRRARVKVRPELIGVRGALAIAVFTLVLVAVGVGLASALQALGVPWPATIGCVPVAVGLAAGGPLLMAYLRRLMVSRPPAGER